MKLDDCLDLCVQHGRAPRGARGLKFVSVAHIKLGLKRRAPRGARGLKYYHCHRSAVWRLVAPLAGRVD